MLEPESPLDSKEQIIRFRMIGSLCKFRKILECEKAVCSHGLDSRELLANEAGNSLCFPLHRNLNSSGDAGLGSLEHKVLLHWVNCDYAQSLVGEVAEDVYKRWQAPCSSHPLPKPDAVLGRSAQNCSPLEAESAAAAFC
jgi:hypothetical protein